jgi:4-carboxymuconolactone decarboxylase
MGDHDSRHAAGLDVIRTLAGSEAVAKVMTSHFESLGALGSIAMRTGTGEIWSRTRISRRDRSLVVISMLTALGRDLELGFHVAGGLNHGLSRDEVDEIMVQISAYAGMPIALAGAGAVARVFASRDGTETRTQAPAPMEPKDDAQRRADGLDVLRTLLGQPDLDTKATEAAILDQQGDMGHLVMDYAFGDVWSRPQLSRRDRSMVVISVLTALSLPHELGIHLHGALNHGVTREEIEEVMITAALYCGFPRAIDGMLLARKLFAAQDAAT